jgi:hypothetical protein
MFPARRFAEAGATPQEIDRFQARFDAASPEIQQAQLDVLAGIATGDIAGMIEYERLAAGEAEGEAVVQPEAEAVQADGPTPEQVARTEELRAQIAADQAELDSEPAP